MILVRRYLPSEAETLYGVFFRAVREGAASRYGDDERRAWAPSDEMPADWPNWLAREITFVAEAEGRVVGFMLLESDGLVDMAFVLPERMGHGVADVLLAAVVEAARATGMTGLRTEASHYARSFFRRHGWREDAAQEVERDGVRIANFRMSVGI